MSPELHVPEEAVKAADLWSGQLPTSSLREALGRAAPLIVAAEIDRLIKALDERAEITAKRVGQHAEGHTDGLHYAGTLLFRRAAELRGEGKDSDGC